MNENLSVLGLSDNSLDYPTVTVAIPTYNEAKNIERVIRGFLQTSYPQLIEVFIADGGSTDGTQRIVHRISVEDPRVKLLHNPLKLQSVGLNQILTQCEGNIFLRADAHSDYALDYIEQCVEALLSSKALNAGGAQRFVARNTFQAGIALAAQSCLGSGGAKYRNPNYTGYAETVYLGCFWRKTLLELSGYSTNAVSNEDSELNLRLSNKLLRNAFDVTQVTNQDSELNLKLLESTNQAIYISSKIRVWYYPRGSWKFLFIQYFKYGRGRYLTSTKHSWRKQLRGVLPFVVILIILCLGLLGFIFPLLRLSMVGIISIGFIVISIESVRVTVQYRKSFISEIWRGDANKVPSFLERCLYCGIALATMPIAHFSGYSYQIFRRKILGVEDW